MVTIFAPALTEADRRHRREFMEYCVGFADPRLRSILQMLYERFEGWNHDLFNNALFPPHFLILEPKSAKAEADYSPVSGWGSKSQIRIRPSLIDGSHPHMVNGSGDPEGILRYWLDDALHELVHQYCHEVLGKSESAEKGHGLVFAGECSRIGGLLGLPPVGPARKSRNRAGLPSCGQWPTCVRQPDTMEYYLGAYRPDLAPRRTKLMAPMEPDAPALLDDEAEDDEAEIPSVESSQSPLSPAEWRRLFAVTVELDGVADLVERLAKHHKIPLVQPQRPAPGRPTPAAPALPPAPPAPVAQEPAAPAAQGTFKPSAYQQAIFDFITQGQGDGLVDAVAGSGKTTTLVQAARLLRTSNALFVAFNRHIAEELRERLAGTPMVAKTIHSIGNACVTKQLGQLKKPDDRKYKKLCTALVRQAIVPTDSELQHKTIDALGQLVNFARLTLANPRSRQAMTAIIEHFGIEIEDGIEKALLDAVPLILKEGQELAEKQKIIDFTDMIWLPHVWKLQPPRVDWCFVDESQDLNAAQLDLVLKCRAPGGRMLFVGDPRQAIYGFAGADSESFWTIKEKTNATLLPLSVCYRCPSSHLDLARQIVPQIEARPGAPAGVVSSLDEEHLPKHIRQGDMILCRLTAPLVKTCIKLIEQRIPAQVRGRDIGKALVDIIRAVEKMPGYRFEKFGEWLDSYAAGQLRKLQQREGSESQIESLTDRIEAVRTCYLAGQAADIDALCASIEELFSDEQAAVLLSTVHRAKGLENPRVFILKPEKLPLSWPNQKPWEAGQEQNLRYVALTRATEELYFVHSKKGQDD